MKNLIFSSEWVINRCENFIFSYISPIISKINLGNLFNKQGKYERALSYYNEALAIERKAYGNNDHAEVAGALIGIGNVFVSEGKLEEALDYFKKSLEVVKKVYATNDQADIAMTLSNIGVVLNRQGKLEEALDIFMQSLEIIKKVYSIDFHQNWLN